MSKLGVSFIALGFAMYFAVFFIDRQTQQQDGIDTPALLHNSRLIIEPQEVLEKQHALDQLESEILSYKEAYKSTVAELERVKAEKASADAELSQARAELRALKAERAARKTEYKKQPVAAATMAFEASHYTAYCAGCTGVTATGLDVSGTIHTPDGYRIVATDPSVIPLGTILEITYKDGSSITAKAADTGGAIKGRKLDVLVQSKAEAYQLGRVPVQVRVVSK